MSRQITSKMEMMDFFREKIEKANLNNLKAKVIDSTLNGLIGWELIMNEDQVNNDNLRIINGDQEKYIPVDYIIDYGSFVQIKNANVTLVIKFVPK
jgi:hypothetical protein